MPLNKANTRTFHRCLWSGILETITLLKRNDDQQQGTVRAITLFQCRKSSIAKTGEPIQGDIAETSVTWKIPRVELDRVGVTWINAIDRIVDKYNRYWQPESKQTIDIKLFENFIYLACVRIDPPNNQLTPRQGGGFS